MVRISIDGKAKAGGDKVAIYVTGSDPKQVVNAYKSALAELSTEGITQPRKRAKSGTTTKKGVIVNASNGQK